MINVFVAQNSKRSDKSDFYENVINLLLPKYKKICDLRATHSNAYFIVNSLSGLTNVTKSTI